MQEENLPPVIENPPIIEALIELRFNDTALGDLIAGQLHGPFSKEYPKIERLPTADIPSQIKAIQPNLKYSPQYALSNDDYRVAIGSNVIVLTCLLEVEKKYRGWSEYKKKIENLIEILGETKLINNFTRLGLRYINFLPDDNFWDVLNLKIENSWDLSDAKKHMVTLAYSVFHDDMQTNIRLAADATVNLHSQQAKGTIIDLDSFSERTIPFEDVLELTEKAHLETKKAFFNLVKNDYVQRHTPKS